MSGKLYFTGHAVDRYIQRHDRSLTPVQARALLEEESNDAVNTGRRSAKGDSDEWEIPSLGITLLVKPDERLAATEMTRNVVLTILPRYSPGMTFDAQLIEDLQREAREVFDRVKAEQATIETRIEEARGFAAPKPKLDRLARRRDDLQLRATIAGSELAYIMNLNVLLKRDHETRRHEANRADNERVMRESLRIAVRALRAIADDRADEALRGIEQLHPGFVSPKFYMERDRE